MPFADLREWIDYVERQGELARVAVPVDKDHEIGAICRKVNDVRGPALLFENVRGYPQPVVANLLGTRRRYAQALGMRPDDLTAQWLEMIGRGAMPPEIVRRGPCQENVWRADEVDLGRFPIPTWNGLDGGPYITLPVVFTKDPDTGERNVGMYRMQVHDRDTLGILVPPYRHLQTHRRKHTPRGEPLPVAIAIGTDPVVCISAVAPFPAGVDEVAMAGAIRGEPVPLVRCQSVDLEVPATAEIVLEGEIPPDEGRLEGPYGEFTGYYGLRLERLVVKVRTVTYRDGAIWHGLYNGRPPTEEHVLRGFPTEAELVRQCPLPGIKAFYLTEGGCSCFNAVASIQKPYEGFSKMMGMAIMGTPASRFLKTLILVDEDVDPFNHDQVEWALATRLQPHRDVEIIQAVAGVHLDPSLPEFERKTSRARTSKMIIDATRYDAADYETTCAPDEATMRRVEAEWEKYGIRL